MHLVPPEVVCDWRDGRDGNDSREGAPLSINPMNLAFRDTVGHLLLLEILCFFDFVKMLSLEVFLFLFFSSIGRWVFLEPV